MEVPESKTFRVCKTFEIVTTGNSHQDSHKQTNESMFRLRKKIRRLVSHSRPDGRYCPVCDTRAGEFASFGIVPRPDARCRNCGSLERHRFFWIWLERFTDFSECPPKRFLHIAPEAVFERKFRSILPDGCYWTADLYADGVDERMDITDIKHPDQEFDYIFCSHVLEHVPDDRTAMRELHRVLSDKGAAILAVPISTTRTFEDPTVTDPRDRLALYGQSDHVRRYGPDFTERLQGAGFQVDEVSSAQILSEEERVRMAIGSQSFFVCRKQLQTEQ